MIGINEVCLFLQRGAVEKVFFKTLNVLVPRQHALEFIAHIGKQKDLTLPFVFHRTVFGIFQQKSNSCKVRLFKPRINLNFVFKVCLPK